jgi:hypothetical protein
MSDAKRPVRERRTLVHPSAIKPEDWLRFVQLDPFERAWRAWGLSDDDLRAAEMLVLLGPERYPVIPGTGGVRKLRFSAPGWSFGKSGAARVYYLYLRSHGIVVWLFAHMRDKDDYLSVAGKAAISSLVREIESLFARGRGPEPRRKP